MEPLAARSGLWRNLSLLRDEPAADATRELPEGHNFEAPDDEEIPTGLLEPPDEPEHLGKLGPYDVIRLIGRGGMGIVFLARDRALDRLVAIKLLTPGMAATGAARRRFAREAKAAAAVAHEHVVTIHAVDTLPQGVPYLVMQYIAGKPAQDVVDGDKSPELAEILRIGSQAASALAAAHAQGLIHRDIKPANILLENGVERVKITDFGLARAVDDATMTQSGVVAGTPQYMSPEQARGDQIDHRTDLFSLGSVLYALCTGCAPFRGNSSMATLKRVCEQTPTPIQTLNPDIPSWLVKIIDRLHAKDPADRYGSAAEVADLLGRCLAHVQQPASVPLPPELLPARNHRAAALWGAIPATLLVGVLLGFPAAREAAAQAARYVATVLRLKTPEGTLVIETDDPAVGIKLDGNELVVTGAGIKELRLSVGKHNVQAVKDGKILRDELVTIERGGRKVLSVRREEPDTTATNSAKLEYDPVRDTLSQSERNPRAADSAGPSRAVEEYARYRSALEIKKLEAARQRAERADRVAEYEENRRVPRPTWTAPGGTAILPGSQPPGAHLPASPNPQIAMTGLGSVRSLTFSPDGRLLAFGTKAGELILWDWRSQMSTRGPRAAEDGPPAVMAEAWIRAHSGGVECVAYSPDGRLVVSGGWDHHVKLWDFGARPVDPKPTWDFAGFSDGVRSVAFSPDGSEIVAGGFDRQVIVLDAKNGQRVWTSPTLEQPVSGVAFSPDGRLIAMAMGDYSKGTPGNPVGQPGEVQVWSWPGRKRFARLLGWKRECKSVAFSPDGKLLAATGADGTTRLYSCGLDSCEEKGILDPGPWPAGVAFRPDGGTLAISNWAGEVSLWKLQGQEQQHLRRFRAHEGNIPSIAFSADGQHLATGSAEGSVKVWLVDGKTAASPVAGQGRSQVADEARRLVESLVNQPRRPSTLGQGMVLYVRDLVGNRNMLLADPRAVGMPIAEDPDWSSDGRRILFHASPDKSWLGSRIIAVEGSDGTPNFRDLGPGCCPKISPDGRSIAFLLFNEVPGSPSGVWLMDADGGNRRHVGLSGAPFWSLDGKKLLISSLLSPTTVVVYDLAALRADRVRLPAGKVISSWPRWAGPDMLVACIGGEKEPDEIALLDVRQPSGSRVIRTLWSRQIGPNFYPRSPLLHKAGLFFITDEGSSRSLYFLPTDARVGALPSSMAVGGPKLSGLTLSPDGRFLLFASDRLHDDVAGRADGPDRLAGDRRVERLADVLKRNPPEHSARAGERMQLYMRDLSAGGTVLIADEPVPGLTWTGAPDWSPDGTRLAFDASPGKEWSKSRMMILEAKDGKPSYREIGMGNCPRFSPDGQSIAFLLNPGASPNIAPGAYIMDADGSDLRPVGFFGAPFWSPDGKTLLVNSFSDPTESNLHDLATGKTTRIAVPGQKIFSWPRWAGDGRLIACLGAGNEPHMIALVDIRRPEEPQVVQTLWERKNGPNVYARWPLHDRSTGRSFFVGVQGKRRTLFGLDPGHTGPATAWSDTGREDEMGGLALSPGGRFLLFGANRPDRAGTSEPRAAVPEEKARTLAEVLQAHPPKSSNGPGTRMQIYLRDLTENRTSLIIDEPIPGLPWSSTPDWSHDGTRIVFDTSERMASRSRLMILERKDGRPSVRDLGPGSFGAFSPNDQLIAFAINPADNPEEAGYWLMGADGTGRRRIMADGFGAPVWSKGGRKLLLNSFEDPAEIRIHDLENKTTSEVKLDGQRVFSWPSWAGDWTLVASIGAGDEPDSIVMLDVRQPDQARIARTLWKRSDGPDIYARWPVYTDTPGVCYFIGANGARRSILKVFAEGPAYDLFESRAPSPAVPVEGPPQVDYLGGLNLAPGGRYLVFNAHRPFRAGYAARDEKPAQVPPPKEADRLADVLKEHPPAPRDPNGIRMQLYLRDMEAGSIDLIVDEPLPGLTRTSMPSWLPDGTGIAFHATPDNDWSRARMLVLRARDGKPAIDDIGPGTCPAYSPDGKRIAFLAWSTLPTGEEPGAYIMNADGTGRQRVPGPGEHGAPYWSPDGKKLMINPISEPTESTVLDLGKKGYGEIIRVAGHELVSWPRWVGNDRVVAIVYEGGNVNTAQLVLLDVSTPSRSRIIEFLWRLGPALEILPRWPVYRASADEYYFVGVKDGKERNLFRLSPGRDSKVHKLQDRYRPDQLEGLVFSPGERYLVFNANRPDRAKHAAQAEIESLDLPVRKAEWLRN
ncbi:MAG: protein kinase [Isosphaeraceae bacterium]